MGPPNRNNGYDEIKRCLAEADRAFVRAGAAEDHGERQVLIDEAESWLVKAERRLARITDRQSLTQAARTVASESRSFSEQLDARRAMIWRGLPKA
jgi:hypothetical protein